jgi:hypothetical protein
MWRKIPVENRKKFSRTIYVVLPICFVIGYFLGTKLIALSGHKLDSKGLTFVALSLIPLYIMSVITVYRKLSK